MFGYTGTSIEIVPIYLLKINMWGLFFSHLPYFANISAKMILSAKPF